MCVDYCIKSFLHLKSSASDDCGDKSTLGISASSPINRLLGIGGPWVSETGMINKSNPIRTRDQDHSSRGHKGPTVADETVGESIGETLAWAKTPFESVCGPGPPPRGRCEAAPAHRHGDRGLPARPSSWLAQAGPRSPAPSLASNTGAHLHTHKRLHARTHGRSGSPCADLSGIPPAPAHAESLPSGIPPAPAHAEPLPSGLIAEWPRPAETGRDSRSAAARPACGPSTPGRLAQGD